MKTEKFRIEVERGRSRAHRILFDANSPFKPSKVARRDRYVRNEKHRARQHQEA